jgi:replicative DNA helicase
MNEETAELLRQIKAYRNDMVARNYPFQQISDIITKWETKKVETTSEKLQDELEPIKDFLEEAEKEKKELNESYQESVRQTKERKNFHPKAIDGYSE